MNLSWESILTNDIKSREVKNIRERYEILGDPLGSGVSSTVFRARCQQTGTLVALKAIPLPYIAEHENARVERLRREIRIMQDCDHPHIIKYYGSVYTTNTLYLALEYCAGGTLFDLFGTRVLRDEGFTEAETRELFKQLLSAIEYLHDKGIVHRDIKPDNVLLSKTMEEEEVVAEQTVCLKLADFGFAKQLMTPREKMRHSHVFTPGYGAPELTAEEPYSQDVDMFSFGVILYTFLSGFAPWNCKTAAELNAAAADASIDFGGSEWETISSEARSLVRNLITKKGESRLSAASASVHPWMSLSLASPSRPSRLSSSTDNLKTISSYIDSARSALIQPASRSRSLTKLHQEGNQDASEASEASSSSASASASSTTTTTPPSSIPSSSSTVLTASMFDFSEDMHPSHLSAKSEKRLRIHSPKSSSYSTPHVLIGVIAISLLFGGGGYYLYKRNKGT